MAKTNYILSLNIKGGRNPKNNMPPALYHLSESPAPVRGPDCNITVIMLYGSFLFRWVAARLKTKMA